MDYRGGRTDRQHIQSSHRRRKSFASHQSAYTLEPDSPSHRTPAPLLSSPSLSSFDASHVDSNAYVCAAHRAGWLAGRKCHRSPESREMGGLNRERHPLKKGVNRKSMFPPSAGSEVCLRMLPLLCFPRYLPFKRGFFRVKSQVHDSVLPAICLQRTEVPRVG